MGAICGIYSIACNGHVYVGQSVNIKLRWREHANKLRRGCHENSIMQNCWNKHGEQSFAFTVIEECESGNLCVREAFWHNALNADINIMIPEVGEKYMHSEETRAKMSAAWVGRVAKKHTEETRARMSASATGRRFTPEQCEALSKQRKGKSIKGHPCSEETIAKVKAANTGRKHTDEERAKLSVANKGRRRSPEAVAKTVETKRKMRELKQNSLNLP